MLTQMHTDSCAQSICALKTHTHSAGKDISILRPELGAHISMIMPWLRLVLFSDFQGLLEVESCPLTAQTGCREGLQLFLLGLE